MRPEIRRAGGDLLLAALCGAGAVVLLIGAAGLPPPRFEPLGSAAMPRILAALLILFSTIIAARAAVTLLRRAPIEDPLEPDPPGTEARVRSLLTFAALVLYVLALDVLRVPFWLATTAFLGAIGLVLTGFDWKAGAIYAGLGAALGTGLAWVFQSFLYISLG
ncbi:tripartite tricarboxylate transporter TctB family protein [Sulfitobacter sp. D35]|uniref:tripartite tricarboxylate transporter TctB family protein n=1 Tax=Sulfitobacter sp. D35 TaxID=3083252 RepID=UPI00296F1200|nr:tripartite tricarboxylate transporter TctB family protein [Sulfitobacter sp. D35]MDW4497187.1 tripartite tricarboxylate transporter TctB family protein [Sulfitobacter sp. D35]